MLKENKGILNTVFSFGREEGFTIIELMVAAALSLIVMTGIYSVYRSQQKSYIVREQVTVMQQNLRAGMVVMTSDIRMAGYVHPNITLVSDPGISNESTSTKLKFTLLANKDDDPEDIAANQVLETITYNVNSDNELIRNKDGSDQIIAENIDCLDFVYLDIDGATVNPSSNPTDVKSIQVTMVARTGRGDRDYLDKEVNPEYKNQQGTTIYTPDADDNFRRRVLTREIRCRNL